MTGTVTGNGDFFAQEAAGISKNRQNRTIISSV